MSLQQIVDQNGNPITSTNPLPIVLTGRNVEEVFTFNGTAIIDTSFVAGQYIDLSKYRAVSFFAINTLDQPIIIYPQLDNLGGDDYGYWDPTAPGSWKRYLSTDRFNTIPANSGAGVTFNLNSFFKELDTMLLKQMRWIAKANTAPTTGALTIGARGVPN